MASLILGAGCLALCIKLYLGYSFLQPGAKIDPNPKVVGGMIEMIRAGFFGIIPALSILLFVNSFLIWFATKRFDPDKQSKI